MTVKRTVEPSNLSLLGEDTFVRAWGTIQGDTVIAETLIIEPLRKNRDDNQTDHFDGVQMISSHQLLNVAQFFTALYV